MLVLMHLALCSFLVCCIMAGMDQQEQFVYWSCLMCTGFLYFMGDDFMLVSVFSAGLGSTRDTYTASVYGAFEEAHIFLEMSSCWSPYSVLSLVRQRIHALRQSITAWDFHEFMRQTAEAGFAGDLTPRAVLFFPLVRPMMRCIMAGMNQKDSCRGRRHHPCRGAEADPHGPLTLEITQLQFDMVFSSLLCRLCSSTDAGCGGDSRELPGGAAGAVPARLWTSLCSCSDKFPAVPGRGSDPFIDKFETDCFCLIFEAFFALRPAGREGQGGGNAGSLLPGVLPPQLGAFVMGYGQTHLINTQVRTTTTTTSTTSTTSRAALFEIALSAVFVFGVSLETGSMSLVRHGRG